MRNFRFLALFGLAVMASPNFFAPAIAQPTVNATVSSQAALAGAIGSAARGDIEDFYAARNYRPIWIENGLVGANAQRLLKYLDDAEIDGLNPSRYKADRLRQRIATADRGDARDLAKAEVELTKYFARYVRDMRKVSDVGMTYADVALEPERPDTLYVLRAANLRDFGEYLTSMGWMSQHYVRMRRLLATALRQKQSDHVIETLRLNLERARILPSPAVRHIVVDAAEARLWYYQAGKEVGTMKVVVGAAATQTPMLAGEVTWAIVNPYWNVPDYLVRDNVARKVLSGRTLASMKMEVLSDWSANPAVIDPNLVDWQAVHDGAQPPRVRELPHKYNSMGKVKFLFPNGMGIYLHDTPSRDLFKRDDRHVSNGCVRLEHAETLGRWMMGDALDLKTRDAEKLTPLPAPVPVYLTYLTAAPGKEGVTLRQDVYGRD